ncbi:MAG: hypothetical protein VXW65_04380, partial [Pseudomonadota bacterium]|nr:hypothetical protein [Pseudomonadota bacterium]
TFTQPLNDVHTIPHNPSIIPQLSPSVIAREEIEQPTPSPTKTPKAEKTTVTFKQVMEVITGISEQAAKDLISHRMRNKKASFTVTALKKMGNEMLVSADQHNLLIDDVVGEFLTTTWTGFRSDWFTNRINSNASKQKTSQSSWQQQQDEKWGGFFSEAASPCPKTVNPDNVISFGALRHG